MTYYDFIFDDPSGGPLETDYWFTASDDRGQTFSPRARLTPRSFDMRTAPDARGFFVGDYEGLATAGRRYHPVFVMANDDNLANRTDVFSTSLPPTFVSARASRVEARASACNRLARIVRREGAIRGPVRIR